MSLQIPPPIPTDSRNTFAHQTMRIRVPGILEDIRKLNPDYPPSIDEALAVLVRALPANELIPMLDLPAPDYDEWAAAFAPHQGERWLETGWFFAETYIYRLVMQAVRWWETGRDPFAPHKAQELADDGTWDFLETALSTKTLEHALHYCLWGNRVDLSLNVSSSHGRLGDADDLLVDDTEVAVAHLERCHRGIHIIADNAGTEMAADLVLMDALLQNGVESVIYHIKIHPYFVSDSIPADVQIFWDHAQGKGAATQALIKRLRAALETGRLRLAPDLFWNSSRFLWEMPARLHQTLEQAELVIMKGDLNYRRAVGDVLWKPDTPFAEVVNYVPAPLIALRTLKSDSVLGLAAGQAEELDQLDAAWRVNGKRGVIQFVQRS